ncbi:MAG: transporter substrate-binding domain-containing protein [Bauldia sp.]|nr:transporter substrate-binding domain-containing protein [Bauldia sp.]
MRFLIRSTMAAILAITIGSSPAVAQYRDFMDELPEHMLRITRRVTGDEIAFCINTTSMLADFERALAQELADTLLLRFEVVDVNPVTPTDKYDFRLPLIDGEIYLFLAHECDALMGLTEAADYPEWLHASPAYLATDTVFVTRSQMTSMNELPRSASIGVRLFSLAGGALTNYLRVLPEASRWTQLLYPSHEFILDRLADGTIDAALIWRPALTAYLADHPDAPDVHVVPGLTFPVAQTRFVLGLRPREDFLNLSLAQAIESLREQGVLDRLAREYGLVAPDQ